MFERHLLIADITNKQNIREPQTGARYGTVCDFPLVQSHKVGQIAISCSPHTKAPKKTLLLKIYTLRTFKAFKPNDCGIERFVPERSVEDVNLLWIDEPFDPQVNAGSDDDPDDEIDEEITAYRPPEICMVGDCAADHVHTATLDVLFSSVDLLAEQEKAFANEGGLASSDKVRDL
jgi:hypothetical protein